MMGVRLSRTAERQGEIEMGWFRNGEAVRCDAQVMAALVAQNRALEMQLKQQFLTLSTYQNRVDAIRVSRETGPAGRSVDAILADAEKIIRFVSAEGTVMPFMAEKGTK